MMDNTAASEDLDFKLLCILRDIDPHNYSYLFERCRTCNVNARQLRFLKKDHLRELIPKTELGILAEFEYLLNQWRISEGYASFNTKIQLNGSNESKNLIIAQGKPQVLNTLVIAKEKPQKLSNNQSSVVAKQSINSNILHKNLQGGQISSSAMLVDEPEELLIALDSDEKDIQMPNENIGQFDEIEKFTLEKLIPKVLKKYKEIYNKNKVLSPRDRRVLCGSIVDYFVRKKIKFNTDIMDYVAEQIVEHFPTEDKKSWCNPGNNNARGRLSKRYVSSNRWNKNRSSTAKQANISTSKVVTNSTLNEPKPAIELEPREKDCDEDSKFIQTWLKSHEFENFSEIIDLWEDTMKYRCLQMKHLKDLKSIREFLNEWPSYKLETAHELLTMDFKYFYPQAMQTFQTHWLVYKQHIEAYFEVELDDVNCRKFFKKYLLQKNNTNEDSICSVLIYLIHAITKPLGHFKTANGTVCYSITDSQHSMMRLIQNKTELDEYTEPYPCIFVMGNSLLEIQECYVVFMDLRYKLSYVNCLAVCVQIFSIFQVEDPQASQCFWVFIRGYMFDMAKDKEKYNEATDDMVTYLETSAFVFDV